MKTQHCQYLLLFGALVALLISQASVAQLLEDIDELSVVVDVEGTDIVDSSSVRNRVEVALRRNGIAIDTTVLSITTFSILISTPIRPTTTGVAGIVQVSLYRKAIVGTESKWATLHRDSLRTMDGDTIDTAYEMWIAMMMKLLGLMDWVTVWTDTRIFTSPTTTARSMIFDVIDRLMDTFINDYLKENQR